MKGAENWILRGCYRIQWNEDKERESGWGAELANVREVRKFLGLMSWVVLTMTKKYDMDWIQTLDLKGLVE